MSDPSRGKSGPHESLVLALSSRAARTAGITAAALASTSPASDYRVMAANEPRCASRRMRNHESVDVHLSRLTDRKRRRALRSKHRAASLLFAGLLRRFA